MVTITNILQSWLMGDQDYTQGVDIFRRVSKDASLVSYFRRFASGHTGGRLKDEMEKLYQELKEAPTLPNKEAVVTDRMMEDLRIWLDCDRNYFEGIEMLLALSGDASLKDFFMDHFSNFSQSLLHKELARLYKELEKTAAQQKAKTAAPVTILDQLRRWLNGEREYAKGVEIFCKSSEDASLISFFKDHDTDYSHVRLDSKLEDLYKELCSKEETQQNATVTTLIPDEGSSIEQEDNTLKLTESNSAGDQSDELDPGDQNGTVSPSELSQQDANIPDAELKHVIDNIRKSLSKLRQREQTPERMVMIQKHQIRLELLLQRWNSLNQIS